jgi:hypothetical protein
VHCGLHKQIQGQGALGLGAWEGAGCYVHCGLHKQIQGQGALGLGAWEGAGRFSWYTRPHSKNATFGNCLFLEI